MTKKTFFAATLLLVGCGLLALVAFTVMSRLNQSGAAVIWTANFQPSSIQQLVFEADGKTFISVGSDIRKWDVASGKLKAKLPQKGNSWMRYSSDGKYFAYGIYKYSAGEKTSTAVNLHDASTNALLQTYNLPGETKTKNISHDEAVFSNQGGFLNINYRVSQEHPKTREYISNEVCTVWNTRTRKKVRSCNLRIVRDVIRIPDYYVIPIPDNHQAPFFSPDDRQLWILETRAFVTLEHPTPDESAPHKVDLTNVLDNKVVATFYIEQDSNASLPKKWNFACASPKDSLVVAVSGTGELTVDSQTVLYGFDPQAKKVRWKRSGEQLVTEAIAFSPDGKFIAWGGQDESRSQAFKGKLLLLDPMTGNTVQEITEQNWADSKLEDKIYQAKQIKNKQIRKIFGGNPTSTQNAPVNDGFVTCLAFSPDSKLLAVAYSGGRIKLWKVQ